MMYGYVVNEIAWCQETDTRYMCILITI